MTTEQKLRDPEFLAWCERHDLPPHLSREAYDDAASIAQPPAPEQGDAHHWPQQGDQSWPSAPEQQAPQGVVFVCPEKDAACEEVFKKCSNCPAAPKAAKPETERATVNLPIIGAVYSEHENSTAISLLRRLVESIEIYAGGACWDHSVMFDLRDEIERLADAALLAADSKAGGEPVAEIVASRYGGGYSHSYNLKWFHGVSPLPKGTKLYTRPQQQAKPLKLTDAVVCEKARLWVQDGGSWRGLWNDGTEKSAQLLEGLYSKVFREAERAYGIGKYQA